MTDEVAVQQPPSPPKEEKKPATSTASTKSSSKVNQKTSNRPNNPSQARRKPSSAAGESGSETGGGRKGNENNRKPQGGVRGSKNRTPSQGRPTNSNNGQTGNRQASKSNSSTPTPVTGAETSDALSSLQRVIADLKTASSAVQPSAIQPTTVVSSLPLNAPIFQPGMQAWPGPQNLDPARHRKAASVATYSSNSSLNFAPTLDAMTEGAEDVTTYEEREIQDNGGSRQPIPRRSLSQNFSPPRFVALTQGGEVLGSSGRPQLAPGFMFGRSGTQRRGSSNGPMGPPISEEDIGFQFPQQQTRPLDGQGLPRQDDSGAEITGIMAEQVDHLTGAIPYQWLNFLIDRYSKADRSIATTTTGTLSAAACF